MGTHGRHGLKHLLMGSVAEAIFRNATCPVLTVGPHVTVRPSHDFKAENILFPTDLGAHAEFATQYALSIAQESRAQVTFMHVVSLEEAFQRDRAELVAIPIRNWKLLCRRKQRSGARRKWWLKWAIR